MAEQPRSIPPCLARLRVINDRMKQLSIIIDQKLTSLENKSHELSW